MKRSNRFKPIPIGTHFGRWTVVAFAGGGGTGNSCNWRCRCECGQERDVASISLRAGSSTGCGCVNRANLRHGGVGTRTYRIWKNMRVRCSNPKIPHFKDYGGRGIAVCERWNDYANFLADMGECPAGLSIERENVNGNYEPSNCHWATKKEQANNTRSNRLVTYHGRTQTLAQWSEEVGIPYNCLLYRHMNDWDVERMLTTPSAARPRAA